MRNLLALVLAVLLTPIAQADWVQSNAVSNIAYFLSGAPARVDRYDLAARQWLASVDLPAARGNATAGWVDASGMYVAYTRAVYRYNLTGGGEVPLVNTPGDVVSMVTSATHLYINHGGSTNVTSIVKATNAVLETKSFFYTMTGLSVAPDGSAIFGRSTNVSPADIVRIALNVDGTMVSQVDSPHHGDYPGATKTWVFPNGGRVVDTSGTTYRTSDLQFAISFGSTISDVAFFGVDIPIVLRGSDLVAYTNGLLPAGSKTLSFTGKTIYVNGNDVIVFAPDAAQPNGIRSQMVALSDLSAPTPGQPVDPVGLSFTPDQGFVDKDGIVYLFSKAHQSVFRWNPATQSYLTTIPLVDAASYVAYTPDGHRLYTVVPGGLIRKIELSAATLSEVPFATVPLAPPRGLATAGPYVFSVDSASGWASHHTFTPNGVAIDSVDLNYYSTEYIWSPVNQKMYFFRDDTSPNDLLWEQINANGTAYPGEPPGGIGTKLDSPLHTSTGFTHPILIPPDGSIVVLGSGAMHDPVTLARLATNLPNVVKDGAWIGTELRTIRDIPGGSQFQQWTGATYALGTVLQVPGTAHRLMSVAPNRLLGITLLNGQPSFYLLDETMNVVPPAVLAAPSPLVATISSPTQITLGWRDVTGEADYVIERRTLPGNTWQQVGTATVSSISFVDAGMTVGSSYGYRVTARNGALLSAPSNEATVEFAIPQPPQGVIATKNGSTTIIVQWTDNPTETGYQLDRKVGAGGTWSQIATPLANQTSQQVTGLTPGTEYFFRLRAINALGTSGNSAEASATTDLIPPVAPSLNTPTAPNYSTVNLSWSNVSLEDSYVLERRVGTIDPWGVIATLGQNVTSYADLTVAATTTYNYRVKATNSVGESPYSNIVAVTTPQITPPPVPTSLVARPVSANSVSVTWVDVLRETGYVLQRRDDDPNGWTNIADLAADSTGYLDTGVQEGKLYYYRVAAYNAAGLSAYSNIDDAFPLNFVPVLADDFDPALGNIWQVVDGGVTVDGGQGFRGSQALWFGAVGPRSAITIPVDARAGGAVEFLLRAGNSAVDGTAYWDDSEAGESVVLEYSNDGTNWTLMQSFDTTAPNFNTWKSLSVELPAGARGPNVRFRWRQLLHSGAGFDAWALEDVAVKLIAPPILDAPAALLVTPNSSDRVTAWWSPVPGAVEYTVEFLSGGQWNVAGITPATENWLSVGSLEPDTIYFVRVRAGNYSGLSAPSQFAIVKTWALVDDPNVPGELALSSSQFVVQETPANGTALVKVERTMGHGGTVSVDYSLVPGTATANEDYTPVSGTLTFGDGETSKTIEIPILADVLDEAPETFSVVLSNVGGGAILGATREATVTIVDDDEPGTIAFDAASSAVPEGESSVIVIRRFGGSDGAVSVKVQLGGGTATPVDDFTFAETTIEFAHGETTKSVTFSSVQDTLQEGNETRAIVLSEPTGGAKLGTIAEHTVTILDDEAFVAKKASYLGLVHAGDDVANVGWLRFDSSATGLVTGKLRAKGTTWTFRGQINEQGHVEFAQPLRSPAKAAQGQPALTLELGPTGDNFTFAVSAASYGALEGEGERLFAGAPLTPAPGRGYHTLTLRNEALGEAAIPVWGYASLAVTTRGVVTLLGRAPDGSRLSQTTAVTVSGNVPVACPLYGKDGHGVSGWLQLTNDSAIVGDLRWTKPAIPGSLFGNGVNDYLEANGRPYASPKKTPILGGYPQSGAATLTLSGGELNQALLKDMTVGVHGIKPISAAPDRLRLVVDPLKGLITGSFIHSDGKSRALQGIIVQQGGGEPDVLAGLFRGVTTCGAFELSPASTSNRGSSK